MYGPYLCDLIIYHIHHQVYDDPQFIVRIGSVIPEMPFCVCVFFLSLSISRWNSTCHSTSFPPTCARKSTNTTSTVSRARCLMRTTSWESLVIHSKRSLTFISLGLTHIAFQAMKQNKASLLAHPVPRREIVSLDMIGYDSLSFYCQPG